MLTQKYKTYLKLIHTVAGPGGFLSTDGCDSLLWTGLTGSNPDYPVEIDLAYRAEDNTWHRRPLSYQSSCCTCFNDKHPHNTDPAYSFKSRAKRALSRLIKSPSKYQEIIEEEFNYEQGSTISRDMLIGLAYYAFYNNRLDIAQSVIKRALENYGFMGYGSIGAINIMPGLLGTFMLIEEALGGKRRWYAKYLPLGTSSKQVGYQAHLQVLHLLLRKDLIQLSKSEQKVLNSYAERAPRNALFQFAAGNQALAADLLTSEILFPSKRLPTNKDRKEEWLWQREDLRGDWEPAVKGREHKHHGGDFLFVYWLLNKR